MIYPAAITPRRSTGVSIDIAAALESLSFLESHGVDGITLLGSTGEFLHFESQDRGRFAAMAVKRCRVPILVNVSHSAFEGAVALGQQALDDGAAGILLLPPNYYRYTQDSIRAWFLEFAAQVKGPIYLYNIPQFTTEIQLPTALDLLATGAFAGIKDSSGIWENFEAIHKAGHKIFIGADLMYARAARLGATGSISGTASVLPEWMVAIDRCARAGQDTTELEARLAHFARWMNQFPFPVVLREAAVIRGLKPGPHACPLGPDELRRLEEFRVWFREGMAADQHQ
ncbi:MAG: dihydrodipicolinate synthase family protein [Acidobacteriia bacterium]|nr:dihydrodipicolinate synthase family protein [Terriglobia bacterium]